MLKPETVSGFCGQFRGQVLTPEDSGYDHAEHSAGGIFGDGVGRF